MTFAVAGPVVRRDVAPGVHQIEHASTNCYVIEDVDGVTLVDACFPSTARCVTSLLSALGRSPGDIRALVLTHGHFDHVGFASGLRAAHHVPVWLHPQDRDLALHPFRYRPERNRFATPLGHPRAIPILASMVAAGALTVRGVVTSRQLDHAQTLDIPGRPTVVHVPGHTAGQCALLLPDRATVLTGDALVTLDPYTGRLGPRLVARAATADSQLAFASLDRLSGSGAETVLPGHGAAWTGGIDEAVMQARQARIG